MKKDSFSLPILIILLLATFLAFFQESYVQAASSSDDWPMFRHDPAHSGIPTSAGPPKPIQLWNFSEGHFDGFFVGSSAAVVNGVVYVGSNQLSYETVGGNIYALDAYTGAKIWNYPTSQSIYAEVHSSPAVSENRLFIGAGRSVLALNASTGDKIWAYSTGDRVDSSPAVVDGVVYVGSGDGNVYALNATNGAKIWNYTTGNGVVSSPAIVNGVVYVGSVDGNVYALNAVTGTKIWTYLIGAEVDSSPVVVNGVVYIGSSHGYLYALDAYSGEKIWSFETSHASNRGIAVTPAVANGIVYVCTDFALHAIDASTGTQIWSNDTFAFHSSPTVANDVLYIASYAFNASTGTEIWHFHTGNQINASPVIVNGIIYLASQDGYFYAVGEPIVTPTPSPTIPPNAGSTLGIAPYVLVIVVIIAIAVLLWYRKRVKRVRLM